MPPPTTETYCIVQMSSKPYIKEPSGTIRVQVAYGAIRLGNTVLSLFLLLLDLERCCIPHTRGARPLDRDMAAVRSPGKRPSVCPCNRFLSGAVLKEPTAAIACLQRLCVLQILYLPHLPEPSLDDLFIVVHVADVKLALTV